MGIKDRLETLSRGELIGLITVVAVTLAGAGLWYARSLPKTVENPSISTSGEAKAKRMAIESSTPGSVSIKSRFFPDFASVTSFLSDKGAASSAHI